jgi:Sulfotransferase family
VRHLWLTRRDKEMWILNSILNGTIDMDPENLAVGQPRLILIAGLQKSGTSLLLRLLVDHTSVAENPFDGIEGHAFWGNLPSHAPREFPAGTIYASHNGDAGHEISAAAADENVRRVLEERLVSLPVSKPAIVNKSPYHAVRLPWLKTIFPESFLVAVVRRAVPNIYSLMKKYLRRDELDRPWREDRWYGVKPRNWRTLFSDDLQTQCANQWCAVMRKLWDDQAHIDLLVGYHQLCLNPASVVQRILREACGREPTCADSFPCLDCFDDEYRRGAPLRSKNEVHCLDSIGPEPIEVPPFSADEVARIEARCAALQDRFKVLDHGAAD